MQCPFCGREMARGALSLERRFAEFKESPTKYIGLRDSLGRPIRTKWFKIEQEAAWCCPACRKIILDYPKEAEQETGGETEA